MQVIRHITAEKLQAERRLVTARYRFEESESVEAEEKLRRTRSSLELEVEALDSEVRELRSLSQELRANAKTSRKDAEVISIDDSPPEKKRRDEKHCSLGSSTSLCGWGSSNGALEQVSCMLDVKLKLLSKKRSQLHADNSRQTALPTACKRTMGSKVAQVVTQQIEGHSSSQRKDIHTARMDLQAAETHLNQIEATVEMARAECVDCRLVVRIGVCESWRNAASTFASWSAIGPYLDSEWALQCGSDVFALAECNSIVDSLSAMRTVSAHILEVRTRAGATLFLRIGAGDAGRITTKARSQKPLATTIDILKVAVGALPDHILCEELQQAFGSEWRLDCGADMTAKTISPPEGLAGQLRPYQLIGYNWLVKSVMRGCGCILADDMGLGKTVQCIAALLHFKNQGLLKKPALVVMPLSLINTWVSELARWAPSLAVHTYLGPNRQILSCAKRVVEQEDGWIKRRKSFPSSSRRISRLALAVRKVPTRPMVNRHADVYVASYNTFRSDALIFLEQQQFSAMLVDEAQAIKNYTSQLSKLVKRVSAEIPVRIAISGTPIENRISDLHSIFEFAMPGYLGSRSNFEANHAKPLTRRGSWEEKTIPDKSIPLQQLIAPFVLRRLKTDPAIAKDLPPRVEQNHHVEMTEVQLVLYRKVQDICMRKLGAGNALDKENTPANVGPSQIDCTSAGQPTSAQLASQQKIRRTGDVFRMLHALRQICNHPSNLDMEKWPDIGSSPTPCDDIAASGKTMLLQVILEQIFGQQEKVVIFCQYLRTVRMLEEQIASHFRVKTHTLIGELSANERAKRIDDFQSSIGPGAMILTLGVGGTGITLHAACHVIHFDRCYNPARESQGSDRVHRIGQKAACVFVHRIICRGTFEERIDSILSEKSKLCGMTIGSGEQWLADLNDSELRDLFKAAGDSK
mmetsp:Transcript_73537/g.116008  ORF Transcript_73537/g.116008 Transcript_73537/m.116008 type:complete len:921 (+) Transcript_73537:123-2885(+)